MTNTELTYQDFLELIKKEVSKRVGDDFGVSSYRVKKNNSQEYDCICIRKEDAHVAPSIYLNDFYNRYLTGVSVDRITDEIMEIYYDNCNVEISDKLDDFSLESMRDRIIYKLVNYELNKEMLDEVPHLLYRDMAITFHCLVTIDSHGLGTVRITNEHSRAWQVEARELYELACVNTPELLPYSFSNIVSALADMLVARLDDNANEERNTYGEHHTHEGSDRDNERKEISEMLDCLDKCSKADSDKAMYVLTSKSGINGAACILYPGVAEMISDRIGNGYYILPSSVHELIVVADSAGSRELLEAMVRSVNAENVPSEDILSNSVYHYPEDDFCLVGQE